MLAGFGDAGKSAPFTVMGAGPAGWIGELVEVSLGAWEVKKGDFVTVEIRREGQRLSALKVVVTSSEP